MPAALRLVPPTGTSSDALLSQILDWVAAQGLSLYPAQEEAIFEILAGKHVVLATPTGSGKSLVATAFLAKALADGKRGFYTCPVKALVNEKFFALCDAFGPERVALMTGDASVNRDAPLVCGTAEVLSNMCLRSAAPAADFVVMDEFHYYGDRERGIAWQIPLLLLRDTTFLLMSATLGDTTAIERSLQTFTGREVASIRGVTRPVPLEYEYRDTPLHETIAKLVSENRAPVYLVNFTQRAAAEEAQNLMSLDLSTKADKEALKAALAAERWDSPYGKELQRFVKHGIGLHHAGLLPRYRRLVERLAQRGLLKVVSGTDTLGVGVNIPIRTVLFTQLCKYDGDKDAILGAREFHQIAGRAGRKGFDDRGYVVAQAPPHVIENKRLGASGKKFVKRQPPKKGFIHWDNATFEKLKAGIPEPLESRFAVTHGLLLALLQSERGDLRRGGGYRVLVDLIARCHDSDTRKRHHKRQAAQCFRTLRKAGLVTLVIDERARCPQPRVSGELQEDFSLHQTLSLWLVETLEKLPLLAPEPAADAAPDAPLAPEDDRAHALNVLTLVESILENPRPVLMAQVDQLKTALIDELKAAGVEYEERMEKLDAVEWPKPLADFVYTTFNDFAARHPWVGQDNIAPKAVARELMEKSCSFHDYVRDLGIARVEGVLLRYLSEVARALGQSVPRKWKTAAVEELELDLGAVVRTVDASLLEEWQSLRGGPQPALPEVAAPAAAIRRPLASLAQDPKALTARVRAELHRVLGALARKDYGDALAALAPGPSDQPPWTADRLEKELAPYWAEHATISTAPAARTPRHTLLDPDGDLRWRATQILVDPAGHEDWAIHAQVDLSPEARADAPDEAPIVSLERVGV